VDTEVGGTIETVECGAVETDMEIPVVVLIARMTVKMADGGASKIQTIFSLILKYYKNVNN
jgi:hypothetical protein